MASKELTKQLEASLDDLATHPRRSLVAKLAEACDATEAVAKKGTNEAQHYKYQKASDVAKEFRHELFSRGIVSIPSEDPPTWREYATKSGSIMRECQLAVLYTLTDGTESLTFTAHGVAADSGDKSIYKAKTGALKYFLRGLGLIPDEADDPENEKEKFDRARIPEKIAEIKTGIPKKHDPIVFDRVVFEDGKTGEASFLIQRVKDARTAKSEKNPNGTPYIWVEYGSEQGQSLTCFDSKLFDELKASVGSTIQVLFKVGAKGDSITSIVPEQKPADNPDAMPVEDVRDAMDFSHLGD